ncbi:TonB-dependent receptor [Winogradskyella bathintestinalis]|uniref:TonB-dependent receptor n=1 Tax=Winogradskyella bathintestinalis TaxID=3035208 RepID=A0ABT7ZY86_9FLAO|nr:TonB-dependent receptor [Winogradskyella bathintestinalis]MDN3493703.1 TonB-dependent receptor [Winogradskyella bathintestinalis]
MNRLLFIVCAIICTNIYAQNPIKGKVLEQTTQTAIPYATIYLPELETGTVTNNNGEFSIELPKGTYKIVVSYIGFRTQSQNISVPTKDYLTIELSESAMEMEEVIVSTPFHKLQSENVMKVEQKKIKDLKASGALTLAEGITNIAGVESVSTGNSIGKPVIRGLSSNRVLVYTQGVRLENQQYGDEHGLGINDAGIESVEVIKGPASLLYGSDALGGVLYLNPERFANMDTSSGDASVNYFSNTKGYSTNVGYKSSSNGFKFLIRGSLAEHSDYDTNQYRVTNTRYREQDLKAGLGYQASNFKTEFRYNLNNSKLGLPEEIGIQSTAKTPMLPYQSVDNHIFSSKSTLFFEDSSLEVSLGYIYNNRKEFEDHHHHHEHKDHDDHDDHDYHDEHDEHDDHDEHDEHEEHEEQEENHDEQERLEAALNMKLKTFNYDIKYNLPAVGRFETIVGVQGMNQINSNYGEEILIPDATTNDFGVLATSHIHFETIDVQIGARYDFRSINIEDNFDKTFNSFNGALGFKTDIFQNITARLNLATGFRAPNLAELASDGSHEGTNRYEIGNENLTNEQNFQIDLALEYKNEHIEFFANAFYNKINDYIFLNPNGELINEDPVFLYEQQNASLYGGELGLHLHPHPIHWLHLESSFETVTGKLDNDNYLPLIPANSLTNTLRAEFNTTSIKNINAFVKLRSTFAQNNVNTYETVSDNYNLFSVGAGGTLTIFKNDLDISVSATNLFDTEYIHHLSRLKSDGILNMGRNVNVGVTYSM